MNKGELILAVQALLDKMESWEAAFEFYPHLAVSEYADTLDVAGALGIKAFVTKLLTTIDEASPDAVVEAQRLRFIEVSLREADKDYSKILRKRCLPLTHATDRTAQEEQVLKRMFEVLASSLKRDISEYLSFPPSYEKDSICKEVKAALVMSHDTSSKLVDKLTPLFTSTPGVSVATFQQAIKALESADQQLLGYLNKVQQRRIILDEMRARYERTMDEKRHFLANSSSLLTISKPSLALIGISDKALASHIMDFQKKVIEFNKRFPDSLESFLGQHDDSFDKMSMAVAHLTEETRAHWAAADKLIKDVERCTEKFLMEITNACEHFRVVYDMLSQQFNEAQVDRSTINAIQTKFQRALERQANGVYDIDCLHRKSAELTAIIKRLEGDIPRLTKPAQLALVGNIKQIKERINDQIKETLEQVGKYWFARPEELELVRKLRSYHEEMRSEVMSSIDYLVVRRRQLVERETAIIPIIEKLNQHLKTHQVVVTILKKDRYGQYDFKELATVLGASTSTDMDRDLFTILGNHLTPPTLVPEEEFLSQLASQLKLFDFRGLGAIKKFIAQKDSQSANAIKEKLAFINICIEKGILHRTYLDDSLVVKAIVQLKTWRFDAHISYEACKNPGFINAVCLLKQYDIQPTLEILDALKTEEIYGTLDALNNAQIPLTHDLLQRLLDDPLKCALICQQNAYRESLLPADRIQRHAFKGVLNDILNLEDKAVIKALSDIGKLPVNKGWPQGYLHSMLYLLQANSSLTAVLENNPLQQNVPFLGPLIQQLPSDAGSLSAYWGEDGVRIGNPAEKVHEYIKENKYGSTLLRRLRLANQTPEPYCFTQMSQFMGAFNTYLDSMVSEYNKSDSDDFKKVVERYRRRTMQILLTVSSPQSKKECLEKLTSDTFKQENQQFNVFLDLFQILSQLWIVIIPVRLALNKSAFFSEEKSKIHHDISRLTERLDGLETQPPADPSLCAG